MGRIIPLAPLLVEENKYYYSLRNFISQVKGEGLISVQYKKN